MRWQITTPNGHILEVEDDNKKYIEGLQERGYEVVKLPNVCIACEG